MAIIADDNFEDNLKNTLNPVIEEVVKAVSERAKKLLQQHINVDTYGIGKTNMGQPSINKSYLDGTGKPSYEFRDKAWDTQFQKDLEGYLFSLFYDGSKLTPPSSSSPYLHGNASGANNINRTSQMADILNVSGVAPDGDMHDTKIRQPFWDNFEDELRQKIGGWLYTEFNNRGLTIPALKLYKGDFVR